MLFTVGHSNHSLDVFLQMLQTNDIEVLADVRSVPTSRYVPHFNHEALRLALYKHGMRYLWLEELGGRPKSRAYFDADGHANYLAMSQSDFFLSGLDRLKKGIEKYRVAIMCSEENPNECHRRLLIVRTLCQQDPAYADEIAHIRKGGRVESECDLQAMDVKAQPSLWEPKEEAWRSPKAILSTQ